MKGLVFLPTLKQLQKAYEELQKSKYPFFSQQIALLSQWCRFDPRLAEQLVSHLAQNWKNISPLDLRIEILKQPWPASLGVLLFQIADFGQLEPGDKKLFQSWSRCVLTGIKPAPHEQYFIGHRALGGVLMLEDVLFSHRSYQKWGYFGREVLINKAIQNLEKTVISKKTREKLLADFLKTHKRFTVADYRLYLGNAISVRQAQLDLSRIPKIKATGHTRGKVYRVS